MPPCTILQAACAAIASNDYFDPVRVGEGYNEVELRSGLVGYANPTLELLNEATRVFGGDCWAATLVSIGGKPMSPSEIVTGIQSLEAFVTNTGSIHRDLYHRLHQLNMYFRFDVPQQPNPFNDTRSVYSEIQGYKSDGRISQLINEAVKSIHLRQKVKVLSELSKNHTGLLLQSNFTISVRQSGASGTQTETIGGSIFRRKTGYTRCSSFRTRERFSVAIKRSDHQCIGWIRWIREDTDIIEVRT
jgi:hypothetical protein